ncbi:hypothetical protein [Streptomyces sp. WMMB303]|uniref:hypothetical protein n=1 Tax=Streptomyces sp. WMMB303 TaxID=3034154 RepID=UPI0023EC92AD|nr:hypothetical protein [Streptomyces sp. WMMB303]MDF4254588.1 hypothetical protein [Streptomyces sp. WMMB303]
MLEQPSERQDALGELSAQRSSGGVGFGEPVGGDQQLGVLVDLAGGQVAECGGLVEAEPAALDDPHPYALPDGRRCFVSGWPHECQLMSLLLMGCQFWHCCGFAGDVSAVLAPPFWRGAYGVRIWHWKRGVVYRDPKSGPTVHT